MTMVYTGPMNYCPQCGDRTYHHGRKGCEVVSHVLMEGEPERTEKCGCLLTFA